jgi:hypothetical protein
MQYWKHKEKKLFEQKFSGWASFVLVLGVIVK